jgi:hypothetical protein
MEHQNFFYKGIGTQEFHTETISKGVLWHLEVFKKALDTTTKINFLDSSLLFVAQDIFSGATRNRVHSLS